MDLRHNRPLRIISTIVLAFFFWTSGGGVQIAYAFKGGSGLLVTTGDEKKNRKHEEKLQKTLEEIEGILTDARTDTGTKKDKIKTKKGEIDSLDADIKKRFQETEKKLYDEKLPLEIVERHYKFVRHYEDNLKELKNNIDNIEKAKTKAEVDSAIEMTKAHLEKAKPPKRHVPLDPNKLPHRAAEPAEVTLIEISAKEQEAFPAASTAVQAANLPTPADLSETIEVQFTTEIKAKAQELNYNPVKIYNWVRNNIEFVPTYGSIQGANYCLQTKQCNAFDTASLLIALLRTSGIHARYVSGTIEIPIEKVKNWAGGFTDANAALTLIASGGIPLKGLTSGGKIAAARMEHVWVEAWIDYIPSRGARHKAGKGDTWIRLDASFKQYNYTQGIDIKTAVPFDGQAFIDQIKTTATINEAEGYVTNVNSPFIQQAMQNYQAEVQNYIKRNHPGATVGDALGKKEIIKQEFSYLLGTLPYRTVVKGAVYTSIPDSLRHKIKFNVIKDIYDSELGTPINITKSLPEIAGKKITLSYSPATQADENVINSYLPKPNPDGSPIRPDQLPASLPAYLINLKPELKIDGITIAIGTSVGMGAKETFTMTFSGPNQQTDNIINELTAGSYYAIAINPGRISEAQILNLKTKLEATKARLQASDFTGLTNDDILGDLLYVTALSYYAQLDTMNFIQAKIMGIASTRLVSESIFAFDLSVNYTFGVPRSVSAGGLSMDVDRNVTASKALDGDNNKKVQYLLASGMNSSALEHAVPEQLFSTPENPAQGISAIKALKIANDQGIPIYTISQSNIAVILPQLQVSADVKTNITNAVNAGKVVTVSKTNINFNGWIGVGYIIIDPVTGAGAYMIEAISGGWLILFWVVQILLSLLLRAPIGILVSTLVSIIGSYVIKILSGEDVPILTERQVAGTILNIITQITMAAGIVAVLPLGTIGLFPFTIFVLCMAVIDFIIFFYTKYWNDNFAYFIALKPQNERDLM